MNAIGFIFARGGSKGLPGKNIRPLCGKPLISWSIEQAQAVPRIQRVIVSTDSYAIAGVAREQGAEVPFIRPAELAQDDSAEWMAWRHALEYLRKAEGRLPEAMVVIPATAPLRLPADLENCLDLFARGDTDIVITVTESRRNPYFNMVKTGVDGFLSLVIPPASNNIFRRQDAPSVHDITTVAYVAAPLFVLQQTALFPGRVRAVRVPAERAIDIDTPLDFAYAEWLMNQRLAGQ